MHVSTSISSAISHSHLSNLNDVTISNEKHLSQQPVDKEELGRKVIQYSILYILLFSIIPILFLIYNVISENDQISVWWLQNDLIDTPQHLHPFPSRKRPHVSSTSNINPLEQDYPNWSKRYQQISEKYKHLESYAFCQDEPITLSMNGKSHQILYPLGRYQPDLHPYEPFIMDAMISNRGTIVNILILEADICQFNPHQWKEYMNYTTTYHMWNELLKYGNNSKELIWVNYPPAIETIDMSTTAAPALVTAAATKTAVATAVDSPSSYGEIPIHEKLLFTSENYLNKRLLCKYYDKKSVLITSRISYPIIEGLLVRCPLPEELRQSDRQIYVRLQIPYIHKQVLQSPRYLNSTAGSGSQGHKKSQRDYYLTPIFAVCSLPVISSSSSRVPESQGNLSLERHETILLDPFEQPPDEVHPAKDKDKQELSIDKSPKEDMEKEESTAFKEYESLYPGQRREVYDYNISLCSSTASLEKFKLIEWIEYHRMIGVEHFFIYDRNRYEYDFTGGLTNSTAEAAKKEATTTATATVVPAGEGEEREEDDDDGEDEDDDHINKSRVTLYDVLSDYIDYGIVTIVPWPYEQCIHDCRSSAAASSITHSKKLNHSGVQKPPFVPPPDLQKYTAMRSCYMRFQSSSQWIGVLDDNDFILFSEPAAAVNGSSSLPLMALIDQYSQEYNNLVSIELTSSHVAICAPGEGGAAVAAVVPPNSGTAVIAAGNDEEDASRKPPRYTLDQAADIYSWLLPSNKKKLLLKSSNVITFEEHYIMAVELPRKHQILRLSDASHRHRRRLVEEEEENYHDGRRLTSLRIAAGGDPGGSSSFDQNMILTELDTYLARRGDKHAKENEYSVASMDADKVRVLQYRRMIHKEKLICPTILQANDNSSSSSSTKYHLNRFLFHNVQLLQQRFMLGVAGNLME